MASNNIEIEAKVLLKESDYQKALSTLKLSDEEVSQTNYYLDSVDRILKKYGMILRIRENNKNFTLTMKAPLSEGLLEKNQALNEKQADLFFNENIFPAGDIADFLDILHIDPRELKILAQMTTVRREGTYRDTSIDLSKNSYSGKVDYELECDSDSAIKSQATLRNICDELSIPFELNTLSKETRAINAATDSK